MQNKTVVIATTVSICIIAFVVLVSFGVQLKKVNFSLKSSVGVAQGLRAQVTKLTKENKEYEDKLKEAETKSAAFQQEKQALELKLSDLKNKSEGTQDLAKSQAEKIATLEKEFVPVKELKKQLAEKNKKIKEAESQADDSREQLARLEKDFYAVKKNLEKAQDQLSTIVPKTEEKVRSVFERETNKLESELGTSKNYIKLVEKERDENIVKVAELKQDLNDTVSKLASVTASNKALKQEVADMHYNLGVIFSKQENYRSAIREFEKVLESRPDDADSHYNLAVIYDGKLNDNKRALEHYRAYLRISPQAKDAKKVSKWIIDNESEMKVSN